MKRRENGLIDMTPLLDVVFILLFALILNVNVTKAEEKEARDQVEATLRTSIETKEEAIASLEEDLSELEKSLEASNKTASEWVAELKSKEAALAQALEASSEKTKLMEAYAKSLSEVLERQVELATSDLEEPWIESEIEEVQLLEEWLKYKQISERYLFVDLHISSSDGRIYLEDDYTEVNIEPSMLANDEARRRLKEDLQLYIYDWLDHKEGGYSFIFVSVVTDEEVRRAVVEVVFDSLQGLQTSFDKDRYLINRFVTYE